MPIQGFSYCPEGTWGSRRMNVPSTKQHRTKEIRDGSMERTRHIAFRYLDGLWMEDNFTRKIFRSTSRIVWLSPYTNLEVDWIDKFFWTLPDRLAKGDTTHLELITGVSPTG